MLSVMAVSSTTPQARPRKIPGMPPDPRTLVYRHERRAHLPDPHLRVPDELPRLRAPGRAAGGSRLPAGPTAARPGCGRVQHLRRPGERRQPAVREPRPPAAGEERAAGHADRRRRLPGAEGPGRHRAPGAVGGRGVRHPQHRLPAGAAGTRPGAGARRRSRSSSRWSGSRRCCPPAASPRTRPGSPSRSAATTRARSASCRACAGGRRTAAPATCSPRSGPWSATGFSRSRCWGRTSTPTAWGSGTARRSACCCGRAGRSTAWSGSASPRRTRPISPTT